MLYGKKAPKRFVTTFISSLYRSIVYVVWQLIIQVKLVEANECSLMSYHYNNCGKQKVVTSDNNTSMSIESARRILFKDFGGKKAMKVLDRKEKMKINVDVVKEQLDKTLLGLYYYCYTDETILHSFLIFTFANATIYVLW